jgi:hypothetical protein
MFIGLQLFFAKPSTCPRFFTGLKMVWTSASSSRSSGSVAHFAQLRMFSGFALPAMVVVTSGFARLNWSASLAISTLRFAQC